MYTRTLQRFNLVLCATFATGDDSAGVAHASPRWSSDTGDESDNRFLGLALLDELCRVFFGRTTDLPDHDNRLGLRIGEKQLEAIDEICAVDRIAADADAGRLAKPDRRGLGYGLIGQRAGARDDTDATAFMNMPRHDADLTGIRSDDAGTVWTDETRVRTGKYALDPNHVQHRDAFGNAYNQWDLCIDCFENSISRKGRGHVDDGGIGTGDRDRLSDRIEDR